MAEILSRQDQPSEVAEEENEAGELWSMERTKLQLWAHGTSFPIDVLPAGLHQAKDNSV